MYQHLNLPNFKALSVPQVVASKTYALNEEFDGFPAKHDWDFASGPHRGRQRSQGASDMSAISESIPLHASNQYHEFDKFMQSWLFFGLIQEVTDIPVNQSDFWEKRDTGQPLFLTTQVLPGIIQQWGSNFRELRGDKARTKHVLRAYPALKTARTWVRKFYSASEAKDGTTESSFILNSKIGLSLMILGETLSVAAGKIFENGPRIEGWHQDPRESWGRSELLETFMADNDWCPWTSSELCKRLHYRNIAILQAIAAQKNTKRDLGVAGPRVDHTETCKEGKCRLISLNPFEPRKPECLPQCQDKRPGKPCPRLKPDVEKLCEIVEAGQIPILLYNENPKPYLEVISLDDHRSSYGIVSHVWAEGFCNTGANQLPTCHLKLFKKCFEQAGAYGRPPESKPEAMLPIAFWMDALAIPIDNKLQDKAIENMREVFRRASHTIVLVKDLLYSETPELYNEIPWRIATTFWMRRLWTLQEAYLSRRLYFCFSTDCKSLDDIEDSLTYESFDQSLIGSCLREEAQSCLDLLLSHERRIRIQSDRRRGDTKCTSALIAAVWKAMQGRDTACKEHEILALSTLLGAVIKDENTSRNMIEKRPSRERRPSEEDLEKLMKKLLTLLVEKNPGCIPAGMIFLPGPKMKERGWGWAPISWMNESDPYSARLISISSRETVLTDHGLQVQFPGFLLHWLGPQENTVEGQHFPVDINLQEWYHVSTVQPRREDLHPPDVTQMYPSQNVQPRQGSQTDPRLGHNRGIGRVPELHDEAVAIIVQEKPILTQRIALLVQLKDKSNIERHRTGVIDVIWIRRVKIQRETDDDTLRGLRENVRLRKHAIFGQTLRSSQRWCVDGPPYKQSSRHDPRLSPPHTPGRSSQSEVSKSGESAKSPKGFKALEKTGPGGKNVKGSSESAPSRSQGGNAGRGGNSRTETGDSSKSPRGKEPSGKGYRLAYTSRM